ncbi:hypothetical protein J4E93_007922 [Alternaria ventricosa]|uniref:uncharacterized protein n=1 Tax=Alternaria ventricosa TaxID=1187951 RepID=UPI0020C5AC7F|nr:uncharacterized protein J4E93_007922 [Alternaria ventricosa]KAI4641044.1 hypothetical protein J4E93_007922 [Alternaria ventricosa]
MSTTLSSFGEARNARLIGKRTLEECLRHIVAYYKLPKSTVESADKEAWKLRGFEREVRDLLLSENYEPPTDDVLLDRFGIDWFKDSGTLQLAVEKRDMETVKMLLEAGADVNEDVTDWNTDIREHRAAPLRALAMAMYAKSDDMIRYLAEHGAKVPRDYVEDPYNYKREEFKPFRNLVVELGAVEE